MQVIEVIAKVESHDSVPNLAEIVEASDAVMVARGDLGAPLPRAPERMHSCVCTLRLCEQRLDRRHRALPPFATSSLTGGPHTAASALDPLVMLPRDSVALRGGDSQHPM